MALRRRTVAIGATIAVLGTLVAGAVAAGSGPSDAVALQPARDKPDKGIEKKVDDLVKQMTLQEKLMQLQLDADWQATDDQAKAGLGGVFSLTDPAKINHLQHVAVEQSRLHIPILFAFDTIHGYRTVFPIPLGEASSFDPSVATTDDTIAARETATVGIKQIYSPMVDISHEPRWGRIAEGAGEDPYLGSVFAAARVKAAQGDDYSAPDKVVTSPKHYVAYGQPEGGREYNTTDMSEQRLWNMYLPPFKAAVDAGADTVMCSFNAISGVPGCANHETETDILKHEWHFDGFIESDYTAVDELIRHGVAGNGADAAEAALNAGTDSEMVSTNIRDNAEQLLADHRISMGRIDDAVKRILRVKFRAGLFEHPYVDQAEASRPEQLRDRRRPGGGTGRRVEVDGAAEERREHAAVHSRVEGRRDRPARQRPARHARPVVGRRPRLGRGLALQRDQGAGSEHDLHAGMHDRGQGSARQHARRASAARSTSPPSPPRRTRPTKSCSRSANAAA